MWPALLAAAVAGSGILAKKLFIDRENEPISNVEPDENPYSSPAKDSVFTCKDGVLENAENDGSIFTFSSASSPKKRPKMLKKKKKKMKESNQKGREGIKCSVAGCGKQGWVVDQRKNGSSKRLSFCLKKRRISKNIAGKCQSCASKGDSLFTWGLSVGMMCMMSAGKTEISRLYYSMDETAKMVQELKAELDRTKSLPNHFGSMDAEMTITKSNPHNTDAGEGECCSSVLTEDQQMEAMGMDQLEAELEYELEKLPWNSQEAFECGDMVREFRPTDDEDMISHQYTGIQPSELDEKLSHLLIEQQENQIIDLEAKLEHTHAKLCDKEAELQALKDCVRRLTQVSLKDEDAESQIEDEEAAVEDHEEEVSRAAPLMVGMKRAMNFN